MKAIRVQYSTTQRRILQKQVQNKMTATSTTNILLLAGDIGGTNSRLALYRRGTINDDGDGDGDDNDVGNNKSSYNRPLFVREYLNEDHLGDEVIVNSTDISSNNSSINSSSNVKNFVQKIIGPFLKDCWLNNNNHEEIIATTDDSSSESTSIMIVCCLAVAGPVDTARNNGTVQTSQRDSYLTGLNGKGIVDHCNSFCNGGGGGGGGGGDDTADDGDANDDNNIYLSFVKSCVIINDFVAQGYGCLSLNNNNNGDDNDELQRLDNNKNTATIGGPKLCVGAGTGFGSCYLTAPTNTIDNNNNNNDYVCFPSEYGQTEWAPNTTITTANHLEDQMNIWKYLLQIKRENGEAERVAVEDVVSGVGVANAYTCLARMYPEKVKNHIQHQFESAGDLKGKVVGEHVDECEICQRALDAVMM